MDPNAGKLIIVLCTERSGSTLMTMMLGGHHQILAPPELHLWRYQDFDEWRRQFPQAIASLTSLMEQMGQPVDEAALTGRFRAKNILSVFRDLLLLCGPNAYLVDKTPAYARELEVLRRIERLEPLYIWLVRHPLGYAQSRMSRRNIGYAKRQRDAKGALKNVRLGWLRARNWLLDVTGVNLKGHLKLWADTHLRIESFLAQVPRGRWVRVHYETLVSKPQEEVARLCAWIGIEPVPEMLQPSKNAPAALAWDLGDEQVAQRDSIDPRLAERWRDRFREEVLDGRVRRVFERLREPLSGE